MTDETGSDRIGRRTVLKGAAASGALLAVGPAAACGSTPELDIEVFVGSGVSAGQARGYVENAASDIGTYADVDVTVQAVHDLDDSYGGSYDEIMGDFRSREDDRIGTGQVNLLVFEDAAPPITGCNHQSHLTGGGQAPLSYVNAWFRTFGQRTFENLIITATLRPILDAQRAERAPDPSDVNSFGTIHEDVFGNASSPMATWHEHRRLFCPSLADLDDLADDTSDRVTAICDGEGEAITGVENIPKACSHTGRLSECSIATLEDQLRYV